MAETPRIDQQIGEAVARVTELTERLEGIRSLEEEQVESNRNVRDLAERTTEATHSLNAAAGALREAVDTFNRADPAKTQTAVEAMEARVVEALRALAADSAEARAEGKGLKSGVDRQAASINGLKGRLDELGRKQGRLAGLLMASLAVGLSIAALLLVVLFTGSG